MTARHSPLFTLRSGQSGLRIYTSGRDAADFAPAPLERRNLSLWAEESRKQQGKQPIATTKQKKAYDKMSKSLDSAVAKRLNPLAPMPAVAPEIVNDNEGNPIFNLTPSRLGGGVTQDLEIAFTSRSSQTYAVQYLDTYVSSSGKTNTWVTAASGIKGTNGPIYQYIKGIPNDVTTEEVRVQWIGSSLTDYPSNSSDGGDLFNRDIINTDITPYNPSMAATTF